MFYIHIVRRCTVHTTSNLCVTVFRCWPQSYFALFLCSNRACCTSDRSLVQGFHPAVSLSFSRALRSFTLPRTHTSNYVYSVMADYQPKHVVNVYIFLTYLLTSSSRILLQKLTGLQLVKKFPAFYGTRRFITAVTSARQMPLS